MLRSCGMWLGIEGGGIPHSKLPLKGGPVVGRLSKKAERLAWTKFIEAKEGAPPLTITNKFGAEKVEMNGRTFDSGQEAQRAIELQWLEQLGEITDLRYQVPCQLLPKQVGERAVWYKADFVYTRKK